MKKHIKIIGISIWVLIVWWISQIIFDVFYSTNKESYLWIRHGSRIETLTPLGYEEQHINLFTQSKPTPYTTSSIGKFQDQCKYGQGNCMGFFGQYAFGAFRWINAIQYIAREVDTQQPSDLSNRFGSLHDISPKRYYPYILWQYLSMPSKNSPDQEQSQIARDNTIRFAEKGIRYDCNIAIIEKIDNLSYDEFNQALQNKESEYRYPCKSGELAHTMAFNYFYYLGDAQQSILYYKVASFHDDVPQITSAMPAIIEGKDGNNKTSAYLRYDKFYNAASKLEHKENLNPDEISSLESTMEKALQKMVSEYSLYLLNQSTEQAISNWKEESCYQTIQCLQSQWYISNNITNIIQNCRSKNTIDCHIIAIAEEKRRIQSNGKLINPEGERIQYSWDRENSLWATSTIQY